MLSHAAHCNHSYTEKANHSSARLCNAGYMETLALRIKRLRDQKGLSQQQVGDAVGVSRVAVTKWESGQTANIKLFNLTKLRALLDVSFDYLINGEKLSYAKGHEDIRRIVAEPLASSCAPGENNIVNLSPPCPHSEAIGELGAILGEMSERGQWELIGQARVLAKIHPKIKANHAS